MSATQRQCRALFVSAPASGQGKTTLTAALARYFRKQGKQVRVFKIGPDFLDPMVLEQASGLPVYQLDLWMGGEDHCRALLGAAAQTADLILIEGVMGLYDGKPSSADLAVCFDIPVLTVIDGSAMAQTFGAVAHGLASYRSDIQVAGVFANRVAGEGHFSMLAESLPANLKMLGWLPQDAAFSLPERHLGLFQASEISDIDTRLERAVAALRIELDNLPDLKPIIYSKPELPARILAGVRIAVARDAAFAFLYRTNLDTLLALGAEICYFSPLADQALPDCDSLYLPGGYPELHLQRLHDNQAMSQAIRAHHAAHKPLVAECGGMLYLLDSLTDGDGRRAEMLGLLPGHALMQKQLTAIALQAVNLPEGSLRGHTFHHSRLDTSMQPIAQGSCPNQGKTAEAVYRNKRLTASYMHFYFASNSAATAGLFKP